MGAVPVESKHPSSTHGHRGASRGLGWSYNSDYPESFGETVGPEPSMSSEHADDAATVSPKTEPAPTPLISAADVPIADRPTVHIPEERVYPLAEHARQIANTWSGSPADHLTGLLGEDGIAKRLDIAERLDVDVYTDGGDGGVDLHYRDAAIDVKTVGRHRSDPDLTVDAYHSLDADYYALASRIGETDIRLIGYAPRDFVANAPTFRHKDRPYHLVEQDYLFPFL